MHKSNLIYFHGGGSVIKTTPPPSPRSPTVGVVFIRL